MTDILNRAIIFATRAHWDQSRKNADIPYVLHTFEVAMELYYHSQQPMEQRVKAMTVALLHDVCEDTNATEDELTAEFGREIARAVLALTKDRTVRTFDGHTSFPATRKNIAQLKPKAVWIKDVRIADRFCNLKEFPVRWEEHKIVEYLEESEFIERELQGASPELRARLTVRIEDHRRTLGILTERHK